MDPATPKTIHKNDIKKNYRKKNLERFIQLLDSSADIRAYIISGVYLSVKFSNDNVTLRHNALFELNKY